MEDESPFIEEGKEKPAEPTEETKTDAVDVDSLMKTLEQFDVESPEKLQGKLQNAQDFSRMQSERDQYANELAAIRAELSEMRKAPATMPAEDAIDNYQEGQPIDIESMVANSVNKALDARERKAFEHQQRLNETWTQITTHPKYNLVKTEFEEALRDPSTVMKLQTGQVNAMQFYYDMLVDKYAGVTKQTVEAFKKMKGGGTLPPHMESGAVAPQQTKDDRTDRQKKIDEIRAKAAKPGGLHEDEQEMMIDAALGDLFKE